MNPVLAYAIEHEARARAILAGQYSLTEQDADDVIQDVYERICRVNPTGIKHVAGYWFRCVLNGASIFFQYRRYRLHASLNEFLDGTAPDSLVDAVIGQEEIREAWAIATPCQRRAVVRKLNQNGGSLPVNDRVNLHRLRRRLRERAAATA